MATPQIDNDHVGVYGFFITVFGLLWGAIKWIFNGWKGYMEVQGDLKHVKDDVLGVKSDVSALKSDVGAVNEKLDRLLISMASHGGKE